MQPQHTSEGQVFTNKVLLVQILERSRDCHGTAPIEAVELFIEGQGKSSSSR